MIHRHSDSSQIIFRYEEVLILFSNEYNNVMVTDNDSVYNERGEQMSFKIGILVCLILMVFMACITYYLGKKVSYSLMKYIPVFAFASGIIFYYIKLNFISYEPSSFEGIYDMIAFIILIIVGSIAFLETVIIDIVENSKLFGRGYVAVVKAIKFENVKKAFKAIMPSSFLKKTRG